MPRSPVVKLVNICNTLCLEVSDKNVQKKMYNSKLASFDHHRSLPQMTLNFVRK